MKLLTLLTLDALDGICIFKLAQATHLSAHQSTHQSMHQSMHQSTHQSTHLHSKKLPIVPNSLIFSILNTCSNCSGIWVPAVRVLTHPHE